MLNDSEISETLMEPSEKEQLTLFQGDSLASLSVLPGSSEARKMTVTSGRNISGLLKKQDPVGSLVKMLLESSIWSSTTCFLTWKVKATPARRWLFQLAPSTPRTEGTGFGLLPTMQVFDATGGEIYGKEYTGGRHAEKLGQALNRRLLPTPDASDRRSKNSKQQGVSNIVASLLPTPRAEKHSPQSREDFTPNLAARILLCPTPRTSDYKGASKQTEAKGRNPMTNSCMDAVENGLSNGLKLQPAFVEWMMGYPEGWTELND